MRNSLARTHDIIIVILFCDNIIHYCGAGSPEQIVPISVSCVSGSNLPLNSGKNEASVYGQRTEGELKYMGMKLPAQMVNSDNGS